MFQLVLVGIYSFSGRKDQTYRTQSSPNKLVTGLYRDYIMRMHALCLIAYALPSELSIVGQFSTLYHLIKW